jgi:predicted nucleotidyltransferase
MPDQNIINKIINSILQVVIPDKIILFGSQARGDARSDSDYDILVIKKNIEDELVLERALYRNMISIGVGVDIIVKTPEGVERAKDRFVSVVKEALQEGIVIYG